MASRTPRLDEVFTDDSMSLKENGPITTREVIARAYQSYARKIRNMHWIT